MRAIKINSGGSYTTRGLAETGYIGNSALGHLRDVGIFGQDRCVVQVSDTPLKGAEILTLVGKSVYLFHRHTYRDTKGRMVDLCDTGLEEVFKGTPNKIYWRVR